MSDVEVGGFLIPRLAIGMTIVLVYLIVAFSLRHALLRIALRLVTKSETRWDDIIVISLRAPLNLMILAFGGWIGIRYMRLPVKWNYFVDRAIEIALIFAVIFFVDRLLRDIVDLYRNQLANMNLTRGFARALVRVAVVILSALIILDSLEISITPLLASLGVGGLAVGLALQGTLSNLFAGVQIISTQPIRMGDFIRLQSGEEGYVCEIGWRATRIRMMPGNMVIIPNSRLAESIITNYYLPDKELVVIVQAGVSYASDLAHVERVTLEVARNIQQTVEGAVPDFQPVIRFHTFDSSSINFNVAMRAREFADQHVMRHEFIKRLHARFNQEGIVFPWPVRTLDIPKDVLERLAPPGESTKAP